MTITRVFFFSPCLLLVLLFALGELAIGQKLLFNEGQDTTTLLADETIHFNAPDDVEDSILDEPAAEAVNQVAGVHSSTGSAAATQRTKWLIQFKGPSSVKWQSLINDYLAEKGAYLIHYFPHNTFLVQGPKTQAFRQFLKAGPGVWNVRLFKARNKLSTNLPSNDTLTNTSSITLRVKLFTYLGPHPTKSKAIAQEVATSFQTWVTQNSLSSSQGNFSVQVLSSSLLLFTIPEPSLFLSEVVTWLSQQQDVLWIEKKIKTEPKNYYANRVVQGDSVNNLPLTAGGLKGDGMIIAIGDSGLDINSCFFYDPNHPVTYNNYNPNHRKIASYRTNLCQGCTPQAIAGQTKLFEHGTHTSGTLAGSCYDTSTAAAASLSKFNGLAPNAKLAFTQFYDASKTFNAPDDLGPYFQYQRQIQKATVSSNSWGTTDPAPYDLTSLGTDEYVHQFPNFLVVFCAGNEGLGFPFGFDTLDGGSQSKNGIIVGATYSSANAYTPLGPQRLSGSRRDYELTFNPGGLQILPEKAGFGNFDLTVANYGNLPLAIPTNPCNQVTNSLTGAVALIDYTDATCTFGTQAQNAENAGAVMVVFYNTSNTKAFEVPGTDGDNVNIPVFVISAFLASQINSASPPVTTVTLSEITENEWQLPSFTSRGPTRDGRIKPDVVAPGVEIRSAKTDGIVTGPAHCNANDWLSDTGTSMATPVTAAMATLIQEYYKTGYYPGGGKNANNGFFPSASLVKATLLASGVSLAGNGQIDPVRIEVLGNTPDNIQGFGRIQLNTVLTFASDKTTNPGKRLWITPNRTKTTVSGQRDLFCFKVLPTSTLTSANSTQTYPSLRATLVWTDPPPAAATQAILLINNLDLAVVRVSDGFVWTGNQFATWDVVNNAEQITLRASDIAEGGEFFGVIVNGVNVPIAPQIYSLVVNGQITQVPPSNCANTTIFCPNNCNVPQQSWGSCNATTGKCDCNSDRAGVDCGLPNPTLGGNLHFSTSGTIVPYMYNYFQITISASQAAGLTTGMTVTVFATPESASTDVFISLSHPPSRTDFDGAIYAVPDTLRSWSQTFNMTSLAALSSGGTFWFAVNGYCCGNNTYTVGVVFA